MKKFIGAIFLMIAVVQLNAFLLTNTTNTMVELSVSVIDGNHCQPLLLNFQLASGESIEIPYPYSIMYPSQQLVLDVVIRETNLAPFSLTFPNVHGAVLKENDEIGIWPYSENRFKLRRITGLLRYAYNPNETE